MAQSVEAGSKQRIRPGRWSTRPSFEEIEAIAARETGVRAIPVFREVMADLETPVSAFLKLRGEGPAFLLESIEGGERLARYSFIGTDPIALLTLKDGLASTVRGDSPTARNRRPSVVRRRSTSTAAMRNQAT